MANEFKVKKGLIVEGSGGTVLDIQGSQGQLFSITDSLTGDIFSVSDISGIPIFNINSDGTGTHDGNFNVTGNVTGVNLSGTNTGDQVLTGLDYAATAHTHDDRYYTETESNAKYLLNTTDTLTGNLTVSAKILAAGQITGSGAALQVNGFQRTGNIYLHSGGNSPGTVDTEVILSNVTGNFVVNKNISASNLSGTNTGDQTLTGLPYLATTGKAADSELLDGLDSTAYMRDDGWNTSPGQDADTQTGMRSDFTYENNAPHVGELVRFGASGYSLQLNSSYSGGNDFSFRTRNGDSSSWNTWRTMWHDGNHIAGTGSTNWTVGNDSRLSDARTPTAHTHDDRYYTETESNAKFLTKDGSAKEFVFEVNDEGNISGNRWYRVATVNGGSGGLHIRGHISNHVETFGSQKFDLAIQGRETSPTVEVNGQVDIFHNASGATDTDKCGIRVVRGTDETNYDRFYVWIRTTRYSQVRLHLTKSGNTSFHTSPTMVTTEPVPLSPVTTPEIDTSTYAEGGYIIVDSLAALSCKTSGTSVVGSLTAAADVIAYSDERLKENVKTLDGSKVLQMRGVSFDRLDNGKYSSGVIAQELEKVAPELVIDDGKYKGVAYGNITGYLIEAIKEQQKQINELKKLIKDGNNL